MSAVPGTRSPKHTLLEALEAVPDPRSRHGQRYPLAALLGLAVAAMLCGARSLAAMAQWGRDHRERLATVLGFRRSDTPCVATLHLLFKRLDQEAFERTLGEWLREQGVSPGEALAVDGKTLRGIHGEEVPGVHLVAAYAHRLGIVVGQQAAGKPGKEVDAALALLEQVPVRGQVVTGDAHFAQRELSQRVVEKGGTTSGSSKVTRRPCGRTSRRCGSWSRCHLLRRCRGAVTGTEGRSGASGLPRYW